MILGCGRSGTSIFGELFDQIPGYTYYSEPAFDALVDLNIVSPVAIKVPKESRGYSPSPGLSFPLEILLKTLPQPRKFFWQIRHPLDTIASLQVGIAKDWGHHPRPPDWRYWNTRPLIERCAYHWNYINTIGYQSVQSKVEMCRFEEMLSEPDAFARRICSSIGINPAECQSQLATWSERVQNTNNEKFVEARTSRAYSRADHTVRIGRWRENLSGDDVSRILPIVGDTAEAFGYALPLG